MYKPRNIIIGVIAFLALITFPIWSSFFTTGEAVGAEVSLDTPMINAMGNPKCIEDTEWMRANHMKLLADWKVEVVRNGNRVYVAEDGQEYLASLQNTCFECHSNYDEFCLKCHEYNNVSPTCWTCHVEPTVVEEGN